MFFHFTMCAPHEHLIAYSEASSGIGMKRLSPQHEVAQALAEATEIME